MAEGPCPECGHDKTLPLDGKRFAAEVLNGKQDDQADTVAAALVTRQVQGEFTDRWRIEIPADQSGARVNREPVAVTVTEDDVTLGEIAAVEFRANKKWRFIDPRESANDALAVCIVRLIGLGVKDAEKRANAWPANQFVDWIGTYSVAPDPKDTAGSESSPAT